MYQGLTISSIETSYAEKKITVYTNFDIKPSSVNFKSILLYSHESRVELKLRYEVVNKKIDIFIEEDLTPNYLYTLRIEKLENILGDESDSGIKKNIIFKSDIAEIPSIIEPSNFTDIIDLTINIKSNIDMQVDKDKFYFIQISKNKTFDKVTTIELKSEKNIINMSKLEKGQYFIRARIETTNTKNDIKIGQWSEIITFNVVEKHEIETPTDDEYEPIYKEPIELIEKPINGETPKKIILGFSSKIDPLQIKNIILVRRDI